MARRRAPSPFAYPAFLAPWQTLAGDSAGVVAMRLTLMPWLWAFDPAGARREGRTMVDEKLAALTETQLALWTAPWRFWLDMAAGGPLRTPADAVSAALRSGNRRVAAPARRRVGANRRRLSGGVR